MNDQWTCSQSHPFILNKVTVFHRFLGTIIFLVLLNGRIEKVKYWDSKSFNVKSLLELTGIQTHCQLREKTQHKYLQV